MRLEIAEVCGKDVMPNQEAELPHTGAVAADIPKGAALPNVLLACPGIDWNKLSLTQIHQQGAESGLRSLD